MSLLTPDLGLLFWMLLSFLLVFGALAKFGFPIITGMVDKRRAHITEALAEADKARLKLESVEEDARRMMEEATRRSQELTATAVEDDNVAAQAHMLDAYPELKAMYAAGDGNTVVFWLKDATAQICAFGAAPREIKF